MSDEKLIITAATDIFVKLLEQKESLIRLELGTFTGDKLISGLANRFKFLIKEVSAALKDFET